VNLVIGRIMSTTSRIWKAPLLGFLDWLLARYHQDRHAAELRVGGGGHEVGGARPKRCHAHAGLAGVAAVGGGHEARALLMAGQDQLDRLRPRQTVQHVEILFARYAEDIFAALFLKALHEQVRSFRHCPRLP
jgi:hypothetical protein